MRSTNATPFANAYRGKRVFVTGHTGFKGSWLCEWLLALGAKVTGYSLRPQTKPALFNQLDLRRRLKHHEKDIRDLAALSRAVAEAKPDFLFHLAAQPLVRASYSEPVETFQTNVLGTVHVLEALRQLRRPCAAVLITTDKCYENREWLYGYREEDRLGGHDPYSASKAAAEIAIAAYRRSFFQEHPIKIASARAGNVIGGGDWAQDRIMPDCIRALQKKRSIVVRNPSATRPWQHVLEPLSGYLWLGALMAMPRLARCGPTYLCSAFNFGPALESNRTVGNLVEEVLKHWPGTWVDKSRAGQVHEAHLLNLTIDKASHILEWRPVWGFGDAVSRTVNWYREGAITGRKEGASAFRNLILRQISEYCAASSEKGLRWTRSKSKRDNSVSN